MPIVLDDRAHDLIERRRAAGKPTAVNLGVKSVIRGGSTLRVEWAHSSSGSTRAPVLQTGAAVYADPRVLRYARWHDIVISAYRAGPFEGLRLEAPLTLVKIREWEDTHPAREWAEAS